ncbi:MAG: nucleotidyltransferase domain-containing protein [Myxococcales bacterium]|nr:MAG: nucleotidyltransferase domain-containing protein [Myxococcales bacterium]
MNPEELYQRIKSTLVALYGERLKGVVLYGSMARGNATADSDVDFMVLLKGPVRYGVELDRLLEALYPIEKESGMALSPVPVDAEDFRAGRFALFRHAAREGIAL